MRIVKGATRIVFILDKVVIKIPNFTYRWGHFLQGILSNMSERNLWRWNSGEYERGLSKLLCPVIWCSTGGWILIMKKVDYVFEFKDGDESIFEEHIKYFGGDDKMENYGLLDGRIVKIDYGQVSSDFCCT